MSKKSCSKGSSKSSSTKQTYTGHGFFCSRFSINPVSQTLAFQTPASTQCELDWKYFLSENYDKWQCQNFPCFATARSHLRSTMTDLENKILESVNILLYETIIEWVVSKFYRIPNECPTGDEHQCNCKFEVCLTGDECSTGDECQDNSKVYVSYLGHHALVRFCNIYSQIQKKPLHCATIANKNMSHDSIYGLYDIILEILETTIDTPMETTNDTPVIFAMARINEYLSEQRKLFDRPVMRHGYINFTDEDLKSRRQNIIDKEVLVRKEFETYALTFLEKAVDSIPDEVRIATKLLSNPRKYQPQSDGRSYLLNVNSKTILYTIPERLVLNPRKPISNAQVNRELFGNTQKMGTSARNLNCDVWFTIFTFFADSDELSAVINSYQTIVNACPSAVGIRYYVKNGCLPSIPILRITTKVHVLTLTHIVTCTYPNPDPRLIGTMCNATVKYVEKQYAEHPMCDENLHHVQSKIKIQERTVTEKKEFKSSFKYRDFVSTLRQKENMTVSVI